MSQQVIVRLTSCAGKELRQSSKWRQLFLRDTLTPLAYTISDNILHLKPFGNVFDPELMRISIWRKK